MIFEGLVLDAYLSFQKIFEDKEENPYMYFFDRRVEWSQRVDGKWEEHQTDNEKRDLRSSSFGAWS